MIRTEGKHGHDHHADAMGPVSGFILKAEDEPTLYIIGDSVWNSEIEFYFKYFSPDIAIIFAGEARFLEGLPITMGLADIENITKTSPHTRLIISYTESWNHCLLKRNEVRDHITMNDLMIKGNLIQNTETYDPIRLSRFTI